MSLDLRRATFAALLLTAPPAWAAKPSVAALAVSVPQGAGPRGPEVDALQAEATYAILKDDRFAGIDAAERIDTLGSGARSASAREGLAKSKAGHAAYDNLDLGEAIKDFGAAAQGYVGADARRSFDAYIQALVWQAASRWVNGDKEGARAELSRVFAEDPGVVLDKSAFPPDLMDEADRDRGEAEAKPKVDLEVTSEPAGLVWIDGKPVGAAPLVAKVTPGRHLVAVSAPGFGLASERSVGTRVRLKLPPVAEAEWIASQRKTLGEDFESKRRTAAFKSLIDRFGVDQIVVVAFEPEERGVVAVRVAGDGHVLGFARQSLSGAPRDAAAAVVKSVLGSDLPRGRDNAPVIDTGLGGGGLKLDLGQHGIALITGGVGLAALITGTIFGGVVLHDRSAYSSTPQTNVGGSQTWQQIGNRNAVVSDVFDIVGVVGLGAAAAVWFWPQSGAHSPPSERTEVFSLAPMPLPGGGLSLRPGASSRRG